jgi:hypothetical protein
MRMAAAMIALLGTGLLAGHALAQTVPVPVPSVTAPTATLPTAPVPLPPVPKVTTTVPSVTPPTTVPKVTPPTTAPKGVPPVTTASSPIPAVQTPSTRSVPVAGATSPTAGRTGASSSAPGRASSVASGTTTMGSMLGAPSGSSPSGSPSPSNGSQPGRQKIGRFGSSRAWIATAGPKRRRATILTFLLPRASRVAFVVQQVSPTCRIAGRFSLQGHVGLNRVRFPGRPSRWHLDPGTYRISARTPGGRLLRRVTLIVVSSGLPTSDEVSSARAANVCTSASRLASAGSTGAANTTLSGGQELAAGSSTTPKTQTSASGPADGTNSHSEAVLGTTVEKAARAIHPWLVALLALAIVLLGMASLPRMAFTESANELLARHRVEIVGLGAAALVAVVIVFLLG